QLRKRVSTIVEADADPLNPDYSGSDLDSLLDLEFDLEADSDTSEDDEDEDDEVHAHAIKVRGQVSKHHLAAQLSTIMGYCGISLSSSKDLTEQANEELKRTYSLLDDELKIHHLSSSSGNTQSVIDDKQIRLIETLTTKSNRFLQSCQEAGGCPVLPGKTLFQRYGVVKDMIGRGAYGVIKLIERNPGGNNGNNGNNGNTGTTGDLTSNPNLTSAMYAVKEIKRKSAKEPNNKFIERVLSEFIISSTLNSKYIVKTVDLMVTLPSSSDTSAVQFSQVMECTPGGDLFTYLTTASDKANNPVEDMSLDEVDCFIKQIAKGLRYMHQHGVAHCDLKLENILLAYSEPRLNHHGLPCANITLKLLDFGKSNVFRTKFDSSEQYLPRASGPLGLEPYMAPEEFSCTKSYSLAKKDCWALGIIILVLFNIRKHYYTGHSHSGSDQDSGDSQFSSDDYGSGYLWQTTDTKNHFSKKYRDKHFEEYVRSRMVADYDAKSKEWLVKAGGAFRPIEDLFTISGKSGPQDEDELCELRRMMIYKMLDIDPGTRLSADTFLKGDWMGSVDSCI
ncbi:kinase-like protein, partial [Suhomyces tanzawaensis NRRL Y-17324]